MSEWSEKTEASKSDNFKNALCYIPFWAIVIFLIENKKTPKLKQNIKYGLSLFFWYIVFQVFIGWFFLWFWIFVIYMVVSIFLGFKAYNWDKIDIDFIDDIEKKIKDKNK